jgi:mono/diheme cytochrome c family protein
MHVPMIRRQYLGFTLFRVIAALALSFIAAGFMAVDVSSEAEPSGIEKHLASTFLDMKIRLKTPPRTSPLESLNEDVVVGSEIYRSQCSFCHGGLDGELAPLAKSFSPRPPQFAINPSHRPAWMNVYVIRHGIRWTAMPAFPDLSETDAWRIAMFLEARAKAKGRQ